MPEDSGKEKKTPESKIKYEKGKEVDLNVFTEDGRFYQETEEGEWVDVTEKWAGEEREN